MSGICGDSSCARCAGYTHRRVNRTPGSRLGLPSLVRCADSRRVSAARPVFAAVGNGPASGLPTIRAQPFSWTLGRFRVQIQEDWRRTSVLPAAQRE